MDKTFAGALTLHARSKLGYLFFPRIGLDYAACNKYALRAKLHRLGDVILVGDACPADDA